MTRRLMTVLASLAVCVAALGFAAQAHAAKGMEVALYDDNVFLRGIFSPFKGLDRAKQLNVTWLRVSIPWSSTLSSKQSKARKQPKRLNYRWRPWDDIVDRAAARGINVELTVSGPVPAWAAGNHKRGIYKPNARKFGAFTRALAQHFASRSNTVTRYTIWNEPNIDVWLKPIKRAPKLYRALYAAAYSNIKRVDSDNQVLIGETEPYFQRHHGHLRAIAPLAFLRGVTCVNARYRGRRCSTLRTDGYAHHPYDFRHKPTYRYPGKDNVTLATLSRLTSALSKLRKAKALTTPDGGTPFVYLTEYGYFTSYKYKVSKRTQARYLKQAFTIARRNSRVKQMLQYLLVQPPKKFSFFATHIMSRSFKPYPAFNTLKAWAAREAANGGIATSP